jgi:DNA-binding Lrp family transcriptional regulator
MAVTAWLLVETQIGKARPVCDAIAAMKYEGVTVLSADTVTGPHDVIARLTASDLDTLSSAVEDVVLKAGGVDNTITCFAMWVG